jgi:hypothetical protein
MERHFTTSRRRRNDGAVIPCGTPAFAGLSIISTIKVKLVAAVLVVLFLVAIGVAVAGPHSAQTPAFVIAGLIGLLTIGGGFGTIGGANVVDFSGGPPPAKVREPARDAVEAPEDAWQREREQREADGR